MNICFVVLSFGSADKPASGVSVQVRLLVEGLTAEGHSVQVVTLGAADRIRREDGIEVYEVKPANGHWYLSKLPLLGRFLALPLRELEYSWAAWKGLRQAQKSRPITTVEGTESGMLLVSLLQKGNPTIIRLHGEQYTFHKHSRELRMRVDVWLARLLQRVALRRARVLISPSHAHSVEIARELGKNCPPIQVVPNCIAIDGARPPNKRASNEKIVLFAGRLDRVKGVTVFLKAAALVVQRIPDTQFVVAGPSHPSLPQSEIEAMVRKEALENSVTFAGALSTRELKAMYQRASLVCVPSYYESFGLVALEAMACGLPVVATRVGGLSEIVEDGVTGILVSPGDVLETAKAIVRLLSETDARTRMGQAALARAELFAVEATYPLNLNAYRDIPSAPEALDQIESAAPVTVRRNAA